MHTLDHAGLIDLLKHVTIPMKQPTMIWGQPGVGKSDAVRQLARDMGALLLDIRLGQYDSVDLRGIPTVVGGETVWNPPATLPFEGSTFPTDKPIVLFLDEITSAMQSVQGVAYQLVLDRAIGEHRLLPNVHIIAASNRDGDKGVTNKMPLPLANRFCHVELGVSADAAISYMLGQVKPECVAFLTFRKPLVSTFDPTRPDKAFATPRSWLAAFRVYASPAPEAARQAAMSGLVGIGPSTEFWGFIEVMDKVTPISAILADPSGAPLPEELSMRYATAVSVSNAMNLKTVNRLQTYLMRMDPEFVVLAWQMALKRDPELLGAPEFLALAVKYKSIFRN